MGLRNKCFHRDRANVGFIAQQVGHNARQRKFWCGQRRKHLYAAAGRPKAEQLVRREGKHANLAAPLLKADFVVVGLEKLDTTRAHIFASCVKDRRTASAAIASHMVAVLRRHMM